MWEADRSRRRAGAHLGHSLEGGFGVGSSAPVRMVRHGQAVALFRKGDLERVAELGIGDTVLTTDRGKPVALAEYCAGEIRPFRVLNL